MLATFCTGGWVHLFEFACATAETGAAAAVAAMTTAEIALPRLFKSACFWVSARAAGAVR